MKTIYKKLIGILVKRHDFDNEFCYVEVYSNGKLKDCYFAEKEFINNDGSVKEFGLKYFYCQTKDNLEKKIKAIDYESFEEFDNLFYFDASGYIKNINQ